jgi:LEA14-like dessication related protein
MKTKIKYIGIIILMLAVIAGGLILIFRAQIIAHYMPAVRQIGEIHIKVKSDTTYISTKLVIKNKTFLKIEIDTIKYKISLFNKMYLQNEKFIGVVLHGYREDTIDFSLKIPYIKIIKDLSVERKKGDSASYSVAISIHYSTAFGDAEIPINKSAKLKIPQPPELEVVEIKYKKIRLKKILADATIKIVNHSAFTLSIKEMSYSMHIFKQGNLKGSFREPINIKPNETTYINIPIEINPKNLGKTIFEIIFNKDNYDYALTLNAVMETSYPLKEIFHIDLARSGKMELRK